MSRVKTETAETEINVDNIMKEIRAKIARKKKQGLYPKDLEQNISRLNSISSDNSSDILSQYLQELSKHSYIKHDILFPSSRPVIGKIITLFKKTIRKFTAWYFKNVTDQINVFNNFVVRAFRQEFNRIDDLFNQINDIDRRLNVNINKVAYQNEDIALLSNPGKVKIWEDNYLKFEEKFKDNDPFKKERKSYLKYFEGKNNVLHIGCGRGDFLQLLTEKDIKVIGLESNSSMIEECIGKELSVVQQNAIEYLQKVPDNIFEGILISEQLEKFSPNKVCTLLEGCSQKVKDNCYIVIEAQNPVLLSILASSRDLTHKKMLHPETLQFLLESMRFEDIKTRFLSKNSGNDELIKISAKKNLDDSISILNSNIDKLNSLIYGKQYYLVSARKKES